MTPFLRKYEMRDILFLREIYKVTNDDEIKEIIELVDLPKLTFEQRQKVELFFLMLKNQVGSWYEMLVGMMEYFDLDVINVLKNTSLLEKCKAEKMQGINVNMMELF